jgi:hypothetical protein
LRPPTFSPEGWGFLFYGTAENAEGAESIGIMERIEMVLIFILLRVLCALGGEEISDE